MQYVFLSLMNTKPTKPIVFNPLDILMLTEIEDIDLTDNQPTNKNETMKEITIPTKDACLAVMDYILHSEMEGWIDKSDPWYSTYRSLEELHDDKIHDGDASYITIDDDD